MRVVLSCILSLALVASSVPVAYGAEVCHAQSEEQGCIQGSADEREGGVEAPSDSDGAEGLASLSCPSPFAACLEIADRLADSLTGSVFFPDVAYAAGYGGGGGFTGGDGFSGGGSSGSFTSIPTTFDGWITGLWYAYWGGRNLTPTFGDSYSNLYSILFLIYTSDIASLLYDIYSYLDLYLEGIYLYTYQVSGNVSRFISVYEYYTQSIFSIYNAYFAGYETTLGTINTNVSDTYTRLGYIDTTLSNIYSFLTDDLLSELAELDFSGGDGSLEVDFSAITDRLDEIVSAVSSDEGSFDLFALLIGAVSVATVDASLADLQDAVSNTFPLGALTMILGVLAVLYAEPVTPVFTFEAFGGSMTIDLSPYDDMAFLLRCFVFAIFCVGLFRSTRDWFVTSRGD